MNNQTIVDLLPPILTVDDIAKRHHKSMWTIHRRIHEKKLKAYKDGGEWRIRREWLLDYEDRLMNSHTKGGEAIEQSEAAGMD